MNSVNIIGTLTADPDIRYDQAGKAITKFNIAWNDTQKKGHFFKCTAFGDVAENIAKFMTKGQKVGISGRLDWYKFQAPDGTTRETISIVVNQCDFLTPKTQNTQQPMIQPVKGLNPFENSSLPLIDDNEQCPF